MLPRAGARVAATPVLSGLYHDYRWAAERIGQDERDEIEGGVAQTGLGSGIGAVTFRRSVLASAALLSSP